LDANEESQRIKDLNINNNKTVVGPVKNGSSGAHKRSLSPTILDSIKSKKLREMNHQQEEELLLLDSNPQTLSSSNSMSSLNSNNNIIGSNSNNNNSRIAPPISVVKNSIRVNIGCNKK
jgi:hypothetical protein